MYDQNYITVTGTLQAYTKKAILINDVWVPLSLIEGKFDPDNYEKEDEISIEVVEWFYDENF